MTRSLADILTLLRWSNRGLADILGVPEQTVRRWRRGSAPTPEPVGAWLCALADAHEANPPPEEW